MAESGAKQSQRVPKVAKVKNKAPASVQITAEQLLREAKERQLEVVPPPPKQKISDPDELKEYKLRKRKAFEDSIRKNRSLMPNWIKYAQWEESQNEFDRARSVYERGVDVDHRCIPIWLKYAEMEMKHRQVNHARNIWDRAVTILPRCNQFWYKYTYMEEMLGNIAGARQVFERWMEWEPEEQAWHSYINLELRFKEFERARGIYERFVYVHPEVKNWIKYAKFEENHGNIVKSRDVFERAVEFYGEENMDEKLFVAFARFEEACKEHDRVRVICKYALDHLPKEQCQDLYKFYTQHEKRFGDKGGIEDVIVSKRKFQYEKEIKANPNNYDAWFDYIRLMENESTTDAVRETYERAISNIPPSQEKRLWRRYIYLWINYALYEELIAKGVILSFLSMFYHSSHLQPNYKGFRGLERGGKPEYLEKEHKLMIYRNITTEDMETTRQVYKACLDIIPHKKFTFAKIWLLYAQFEIRQLELMNARKALGVAIGKCPKDKLFREYIGLELQLREFDRCRKLYEKFLEFNSSNCTTWIKYAELETILGDVERTRAIFELAVGQTLLDMPEVLWKAYIDFEISQEEYQKTRDLYERLLERTQHVKVWISYAQFELTTDLDGRVSQARNVYERANRSLKHAEDKEERLMLLESWKQFEVTDGNEESLDLVQKKMPRRVKKRRKIETDDGSDAGWEEFYDYIFPDDEENLPNIKLLQMARLWKQNKNQE